MKEPKVIKTAHTGQGWRIGIIEVFYYRTGASAGYQVIRINPQSQYLALSQHKTLDEAREVANREWTWDTRASKKVPA